MTMQSGSLTDGLKVLITPSLVSTTSTALGESEATVTKGLSAALFAIFCMLASKADDRSFLDPMFAMIKNPSAEANVIGAVPGGEGAVSGPGGTRFMSELFAGKTESVYEALSSFTGLTQSKASSLFPIAGPLALGYLGATISSAGMDMTDLSHMLLTQRNAITRVVPSTLTSIIGMGSQTGVTANRALDIPFRKASPWRWLVPLLLIVLVLWGLVWLLGGHRNTEFTR